MSTPSPQEATNNVPPPAARALAADEPDPIRELTKLAEQLARQHNRRLLAEYLRHRRALR
jgi:hypothetical protein